LFYGGGLLLSAFATAAIMMRFLVMPSGFVNSALSSPILAGLGLISYGLYLWHMPVFWAVNQLNLPTVADVPLRLSVSFITAVISFYVIELPFLRLKDRIPVRQPKTIPMTGTAPAVASN
jgi:peptidoglycan/LPS O-acetylase OafA/YrhL